MKKLFGLFALLAFSFCFTPHLQAQYIDAGTIKSQVGNTAAYFDSTGTLSNTPNYCSTCPTPTAVLTKTVTLNTSQIENLYSVPDTILPAPGANYSYNVTQAYATLNFNSTPYAGDSVLTLTVNTAPYPFMGNVEVLNASSSVTGGFNIAVARGIQFFPTNEPLLLSTLHQNVTTGNSTLRVTVYYTLLYTGLSSN